MHLGNAWTALLAWLAARAAGGAVTLRMEDLDPARSKERFAQNIPADLAWLGLDWDEGPDRGGPYGPYRQSKRREQYQRCLDRLERRGLLYPCYCTRAELRGAPARPARTAARLRGDPPESVQTPHTDASEPPRFGIVQAPHTDASEPPRFGIAQAPHTEESEFPHLGIAQAPHTGESEPVYAGTCRRLSGSALAALQAAGRIPALRVKVPDARIAFTDRILGLQEQNPAEVCGDFALRRSDGVHAYQLAVVADDAAMHISEVVRGADLLDSTARQIALYRLLGLREPAFAHVPLLVDPHGRRLSKRRGDVDLGLLRERGAAPAAIVGYLAYKAGLIDAPRRIMPLDLIDGFSFGALPRGPVIVQDNWLGAFPL